MRSCGLMLLAATFVACGGSGSSAAHPDAAHPDAARPDAARPDAARPDAARPDSCNGGGIIDFPCSSLIGAGPHGCATVGTLSTCRTVGCAEYLGVPAQCCEGATCVFDLTDCPAAR